MRTRVKICGITNAEDAQVCVDAGVDALGFIFYPPSPRCVTPEQVRAIIDDLPPFVTAVGVFVDEPVSSINEIVRFCGLGMAQLHGDEFPEDCVSVEAPVIKAFRVGESLEIPFSEYRPYVRGFLLDTYVKGLPGGTGASFNWDLAREAARSERIVLAGGLTPENVVRAIETVRPHGVDVSSGVESAPGSKDAAKVGMLLKCISGLTSE